MTTDNKDSWIKSGYELFAVSGPAKLKIEPLARTVGKSKSSFYHHFADLELFTDHLLKHHLHQSHIIAEKERSANNIDPDLINILVEHKTDLLFNRQLRIHKNVKIFSDTVLASDRIVGDSFIQVWTKELPSTFSNKQVESVFTLALENFYMQLNPDNCNYQWLSAYFSELKKITLNFR